jgi:hypothetical protein
VNADHHDVWHVYGHVNDMHPIVLRVTGLGALADAVVARCQSWEITPSQSMCPQHHRDEQAIVEGAVLSIMDEYAHALGLTSAKTPPHAGGVILAMDVGGTRHEFGLERGHPADMVTELLCGTYSLGEASCMRLGHRISELIEILEWDVPITSWLSIPQPVALYGNEET